MLKKWLARLRPESTETAPAEQVADAGSAQAVVTVVQHSAPSPEAAKAAVGIARPVYPPVDGGIGVFTPDALVAANQDLIDRLRLHAATTKEIFEYRYLGPIMRLAEVVNAIPATASSIFSGEGGAFRAAMETAFLSFQAADGRIFTGQESVERRHDLEPRWRFVCFAAALMYPIGKTLTNIIITNGNGAVWKRHQQTITAWALAQQAHRLFPAWAQDLPDEESVGPATYATSLIANVLGPDNLQWLEDGSHELVQAVYEIASGQRASARHALGVVQNTWAKVCQRESARRPQSYGRVTVGTQMGPYLIGALRELVASGKWKINGDELRADEQCLYLIWPQAGESLVAHGRENGIVGWPADVSTIAELLKGSGVVTVSHGDDMGFTDVVTAEGEIVAGFRIANPLSIVEDFDGSLFAGTPTTVERVLEKDPVHQAELQQKAAASAVSEPAPDSAEKALPQEVAFVEQATGHSEDATEATEANEDSAPNEDATDEVMAALAQDHDGGTAASSSHGTKHTRRSKGKEQHHGDGEKSEGAPTRIKDVQAVKYIDLLPDEIRKDIKNKMRAELLGKVVAAWRAKDDRSDVMRMTADGAAIELQYLGTLVGSQAYAWMEDMSNAGLIYTHPSTPGNRVHKVSIPEGTKPREAVILSRYAARKLELS